MGVTTHSNVAFAFFNMKDAQKNYTRTAKELNRVRSEYSEMENGMAKMRITLQSSSSNSTKDRKRVQELSEEVTSG